MRQRKLDRLRQLGNYLLTLSPKQFKLDHWSEEGFSLHKCGATACGIGYDCALHPRSALKMAKRVDYDWYRKIVVYFYPTYKDETHFEAVALYYEMTQDEAEYLFDPEQYEDDRKGPKSVARRILKFVEQKEKEKARA